MGSVEDQSTNPVGLLYPEIVTVIPPLEACPSPAIEIPWSNPRWPQSSFEDGVSTTTGWTPSAEGGPGESTGGAACTARMPTCPAPTIIASHTAGTRRNLRVRARGVALLIRPPGRSPLARRTSPVRMALSAGRPTPYGATGGPVHRPHGAGHRSRVAVRSPYGSF